MTGIRSGKPIPRPKISPVLKGIGSPPVQKAPASRVHRNRPRSGPFAFTNTGRSAAGAETPADSTMPSATPAQSRTPDVPLTLCSRNILTPPSFNILDYSPPQRCLAYQDGNEAWYQMAINCRRAATACRWARWRHDDAELPALPSFPRLYRRRVGAVPMRSFLAAVAGPPQRPPEGCGLRGLLRTPSLPRLSTDHVAGCLGAGADYGFAGYPPHARAPAPKASSHSSRLTAPRPMNFAKR
jgi:hypothetical protein